MSGTIQLGIERLRYRQGQTLSAQDFRDLAMTESHLRWWHNRALHNAFGVSMGLNASAIKDAHGKLEKIGVTRGLAYDSFGRELLLQAEREINLPQVELSNPPARMTLLIYYKESGASINESGNCACAASLEEVSFSWKPSAKVELSDGVPLAQLSFEASETLEALPPEIILPSAIKDGLRYDSDGKLLIVRGVMTSAERDALLALSADAPFLVAVRNLFEKSQNIPFFDETFYARRARRLARPRIASGMTVPGDTAWELWSEGVYFAERVRGQADVGMQVTIDTSVAGFTEPPIYFAWLSGLLWNQSNAEFFPVPFEHIDNVSSTQFRFRLWLPYIMAIVGSRARLTNKNFATEFLNFARQQQLHVCWLGLQPMRRLERATATTAAAAGYAIHY